MSIKQGLVAEAYAKDYLVQQGLQWIESNFRCPCGEIDLIMRDGDYLVFTEVRARKSARYGNALESIHGGKQKKLVKTASLYLLMKYKKSTPPSRFDVVTFDGIPPRVQWIKNAFSLT